MASKKHSRTGFWILGMLGLLTAAALAVVTMSPSQVVLIPPKVEDMPKLLGGNIIAPQTTLPILADSMPPFSGIKEWLNSPPLTPESLKGKVVLVDFWTYSCINCIRTLPVLRAWHEAYAKDGLVIIGVHTPEFAFEKVPANVQAAVKKYELKYPIAEDPDYATWNNYNNRYWPAGYLFDRGGRLRRTHFGEGDYAESEAAIRELLAEGGEVVAPMTGLDTTPNFEMIKTPETYFGYERAEHFVNKAERDIAAEYSLAKVGANEWSIGGTWVIQSEKALAMRAGSVHVFKVQANAYHLVLGTNDGKPKRLKITIDGVATNTITVADHELYTIAKFPDATSHVVSVEVLDPGVEFYAATFGE